MNIIIGGVVGSGKTTISKQLSKILKKEFLDTDRLLMEELAINSIHDKPRRAYREKETEIIERISKKDNQIISLGGGSLGNQFDDLSRINIKNLKKNGFIIILEADLETLYKRYLLGQNKKNLRTNVPDVKADIQKKVNHRKKYHDIAADLTINTSKLSVDETIEYILKKLPS